MNKKSTMSLGLTLLATGIVLIVFGIKANNSLSSGISRTFAGSPTNKATWLLIGGIACSVLGVAGLSRGRKA